MGSSYSSFSAATYSSSCLKGFWQKNLEKSGKFQKFVFYPYWRRDCFLLSLFLSLPSPPSPTQISLHKADIFMFPFVQEPSRPDPRSVEMNEKTWTSGSSSSSSGWTQAAAPALRAEKIAGNWQHRKLVQNSAEKRANVARQIVTEKSEMNHLKTGFWRVFLLFRALPYSHWAGEKRERDFWCKECAENLLAWFQNSK